MQHSPYQHENNSFSNVADNFTPRQDSQFNNFDEAGYLQHYTPFTSIQDQSSLMHPGLMHTNTHHQNLASSKPLPLALQTQNLVPAPNYREGSLHAGHVYDASPLDSPSTQLSTPITPTRSSFYANSSAAESMTSFSPSSNTSGEPDSPQPLSPNKGPAFALEGGDNVPELPAETKRFDTRMASRQPRRLWTHSLEKYIFTPHEIATLNTPHRRTIYSHSLEAHIDRIHSQLLSMNYYPVNTEELEHYRGLNGTLAKGVVAGLQHDFIQIRTQLLEIERATENARQTAAVRANYARLEAQAQAEGQGYGFGLAEERLEGASYIQPRKHSLDSSLASGPMPPPLPPHSAHI